MAKKEQRMTEALSLELSKIATCLSLGKHFIGELPESEQKQRLLRILAEIDSACDRAVDLKNSIQKAAGTI
jgi:hypothetical protein